MYSTVKGKHYVILFILLYIVHEIQAFSLSGFDLIIPTNTKVMVNNFQALSLLLNKIIVLKKMYIGMYGIDLVLNGQLMQKLKKQLSNFSSYWCYEFTLLEATKTLFFTQDLSCFFFSL